MSGRAAVGKRLSAVLWWLICDAGGGIYINGTFTAELTKNQILEKEMIWQWQIETDNLNDFNWNLNVILIPRSPYLTISKSGPFGS